MTCARCARVRAALNKPNPLARPEQPKEAAGEADPDLTAALRQIDALRAEGRLSPADAAILRAGADQADELTAVADGLQEAGECLLRNLA